MPPSTEARRRATAKKKKSKASRPLKGRAAAADKYALYQLAVQAPDDEVSFLRKIYRKKRKRNPQHFREDFSGTALVAMHWVMQGKDFTAEAHDHDPEVFEYGRAHHLGELRKAPASRLALVEGDVRAPSRRAPDIRCAENFSYFIFMTRNEMLGYFRSVYEDLADDGMFVIDMWGGTDATDPVKEKRKLPGGVTYIWDQAAYEPATSTMTCHIHFKFRDGSMIEQAFGYTWRYWFLPELRDILLDAGFEDIDTYFEQLGEDGEGTGVFKKGPGPVEASYIAYLVASK